MAVTSAINDLFASIYELLASVFNTFYTVIHSILSAVLGFVQGVFNLITDVVSGLVDVTGGVGKFVASKFPNFLSFCGMKKDTNDVQATLLFLPSVPSALSPTSDTLRREGVSRTKRLSK
jgi:hypothetical protein